MTDEHTDDEAHRADEEADGETRAVGEAEPAAEEVEPADEERITNEEPADETRADADDAARAERAADYLRWAAVGVLALLAVVAALRFYFSMGAAISLWVAPEYESLFQAAFNLVVVLVSVSGVALLLSRMTS